MGTTYVPYVSRKGATMKSVIERIMRKTAFDVASGCLSWTGYKTPQGYGRIRVAGKSESAHRVMYEMFHGRKPQYTIDHLCRNRACVNPWHLEDVPMRINAARSNAASTINRHKTHCIRGHGFTKENTAYRHTRFYAGVARVCNQCRRERHAVTRYGFTAIRKDTGRNYAR